MKNYIFIFYISIILFKTGNVLSDNNLFTVNNIEICKELSTNKEELVNEAFIKAFDELIKRILLEDDYKRLFETNIIQIKELISYYQILGLKKKNKEKNKLRINVFFDKNRIHNFFYSKNILYSDIINTEIILLPLLKKKDEYFIYSQNYFYENWNFINPEDLIEYNLLTENIESIQKINKNINDIINLDISELFKEYGSSNLVFTIIEMKKEVAQIFLQLRIDGKKINKKISLNRGTNFNEIDFNNRIILEIKKVIKNIVKSQNLIDVRTPSFLNVEIRLNNKNNLVVFNNRISKY